MLKVGQEGFFYKYVTEQDVEIFAEVSGDKNPLHLDEEYAKGTRFHGRIAHGMIGAGFISAAIEMCIRDRYLRFCLPAAAELQLPLMWQLPSGRGWQTGE